MAGAGDEAVSATTPLKEGRSISAGVAPAPGTDKPVVVPAGQGSQRCLNCKKLEKKIEELEGALEGAHTIIRQLRDKDSAVKS